MMGELQHAKMREKGKEPTEEEIAAVAKKKQDFINTREGFESMSKTDKTQFRESLLAPKTMTKDGKKWVLNFGKGDYNCWNQDTMNLTDKTKCPTSYNDKYSTWAKFKETAMAFDFKLLGNTYIP